MIRVYESMFDSIDPKILRIVPKKYKDAVQKAWYDDDGYWIQLKRGYTFDSLGPGENRVVVGDTINDLRSDAKSIVPYSDELREAVNIDSLFTSLLDYAKKHKDKFMYVKSDSIAFKKRNGIYELNKPTDPKSDTVEVLLDGDPMSEITSVDEFINLINTGDVR